jgi:hypothetical protein
VFSNAGRFLYIFCSELLLFVKKHHGNGFFSFKKLFFHFKSRYNCFCKLCWKTTTIRALPATARHSLPQESGTSQNVLINPPFILWRQNFYCERIGARILCLLFLWVAFMVPSNIGWPLLKKVYLQCTSCVETSILILQNLSIVAHAWPKIIASCPIYEIAQLTRYLAAV